MPEASEEARPDFLDVLAAAHAEAGDFERAEALVAEAISLTPAEQRPLLERLEQRRKSYQKRQAHREDPTAGAPG